MDDPFLEKVQMQVLDFATDKRTQWESKHTSGIQQIKKRN